MRRARRERTPGSRSRLLLLLTLVCFGGLSGVALWFWWPSLVGGFDRWLKTREFFLLKEIVVVGNQRCSRDAIIAVLGLAPRQLIFTFPLSRLEGNLLGLPFVGEVKLRRRWPDRLEIEIREKQPVAMLYLDELYLVDGQGALIAPAPGGENFDLPLISGVSAAEWRQRPEVWRQMLVRVAAMQAAWKEQGLEDKNRISQIVLDEVCGLTIFTTGQVWELQLGLDDFARRLQAWQQVMKTLGERTAAFAYFDCAGAGSVVAGLRPAAE